MSVTLEPVFSALGYESEEKQRSLIKLLQAAGAFGQLPGVNGVVNDKQAIAILKSVTFDTTDQAAHWLHELTQETMLRPEGQQRSETHERAEFQDNRQALLDALHGSGILSEIKPSLEVYDHVLLLGSKEPMVETRLDTVKQLWEEGIDFGKIHLLGNERPLDAAHEPIANIPGENGQTLVNETDMLKARFYNTSSQWPEKLQEIPSYAVSSYDRDGHHANTKETVETWLSANPEPKHGNVLVISNQPYVGYQDAAVKSVLQDRYHVETVGAPIADKNVNITLAMDALARQIDVNFNKLLEKSKSQSAEQAAYALLDPSDIKSDPATYQFRSDFDGAGVTEKGRYHDTRWDPILHGDPLLVHERFDGSTYVADGHHRLDLAKRLNAEGSGPGKVAAIILREADGYTAEDVKIIAAYKNIAHGTTDPLETARVFKEAFSGRVHTDLLPQLQMDKGNLNLSFTLSGLSDRALDMVAEAQIPVELAAGVASRIHDPQAQEAVLENMAAEIREHPVEVPQSGFASKFAPREPQESFAAREKPPAPAGNYTQQIASRNQPSMVRS